MSGTLVSKGFSEVKAGEKAVARLNNQAGLIMGSNDALLARYEENLVDPRNVSSIPLPEIDEASQDVKAIKHVILNSEPGEGNVMLLASSVLAIFRRLMKLIGWENRGEIKNLINKRFRNSIEGARNYFNAMQNVVETGLKSAKQSIVFAKRVFQIAVTSHALKLTAASLSMVSGAVSVATKTPVPDAGAFFKTFADLADAVGQATQSVAQSVQQAYEMVKTAWQTLADTHQKVTEAVNQRYTQTLQLLEGYMDQMFKFAERADGAEDAAIQASKVGIIN